MSDDKPQKARPVFTKPGDSGAKVEKARGHQAKAAPKGFVQNMVGDGAKTRGERIAKVLSRAGVASRREAERMIEAGLVEVNGKVITSPALNVLAKDHIKIEGRSVAAAEPSRLWLYYKPEGLVTSASDEKGRDTVFDHLPDDMPRVMSVGRLDLNSEGLLLLTNDGELKRQLELPSTGWLRKYRVRARGAPAEAALQQLRDGIVVDGMRFQPMEVTLDRQQGSNAWLTIGLREGKNREIRRAMAAIGLVVNRLIRISYGPFRLNELRPGEVQELRARILRDQLGGFISGGDWLEEMREGKVVKPGSAKPSIKRLKTGPKTIDMPPRGENTNQKKQFQRTKLTPKSSYAGGKPSRGKPPN